jgi:hypothetical protein
VIDREAYTLNFLPYFYGKLLAAVAPVIYRKTLR